MANYTVIGGQVVGSTLSTVLFNAVTSSTSTFSPPDNVTNTSVAGDEGTASDEANGITKKVFLGSILCLLIFLAVFGNILVCAAVLTDRRLKKLNNLFIVSLAVADLWMSLVVMTFAVVNDITGKWLFGHVYCNIWISSDIMGSTASILNLCVISLDRYIHIRDPLKYARVINRKKVFLAIGLVWIISIILSFIPINVGWHKPRENYDKTLGPEECYLEISPIYALISSTISFYIPCVVMLALYCKLYMYARAQVKSIKSTFVHSHLSDSQVKNLSSGRDHKAAITLGVIMGVFLFCWLPFFILNLVQAFCKCAPIILFQILTWLGYANSSLNPIIYSIFNSEFRNAFRRILFPKTCCRDDRHDFYRSPKKSKNGTGSSASGAASRIQNGKASMDSNHPLMEEKITAL